MEVSESRKPRPPRGKTLSSHNLYNAVYVLDYINRIIFELFFIILLNFAQFLQILAICQEAG